MSIIRLCLYYNVASHAQYMASLLMLKNNYAFVRMLYDHLFIVIFFSFGFRVARLSFGGLQLVLKGDAAKMESFKVHEKYFLCMRKV